MKSSGCTGIIILFRRKSEYVNIFCFFWPESTRIYPFWFQVHLYIGLSHAEVLKLAMADNDANTKIFHHESVVLINVARDWIIQADRASYNRVAAGRMLAHLSTLASSNVARKNFVECFSSLKKDKETVS